MSDKTQQKTRRTFLKKAAVAGALTTIPAKSVWATGLTNSIVASGHGSDFAQTSQYNLVQPTEWLAQRNSEPLLDDTYRQHFGSNPDIMTCSMLNHKTLRKISMGSVLGCASRTARDLLDADGIVLERRNWKGKWKKITNKHTKYSAFFATHIIATMRARCKSTGRTEMVTDLCRRLGGRNDINKWMVSTLMNGIKDTSDSRIFFPIIGTHNGRQLPFSSPKEFGRELHKKRNDFKTLQQLKVLHTRPGDFHNV